MPRIAMAPALIIGLLSASLFGLFYMAALNNPSIVKPPRPVAAAPAPKPTAVLASAPAPAPGRGVLGQGNGRVTVVHLVPQGQRG